MFQHIQSFVTERINKHAKNNNFYIYLRNNNNTINISKDMFIKILGVLSKHCDINKNSFRKELKDFAIPLSVKLGNDHELFWKWYLASNDVAKDKIKALISNKSNSSVENSKEEVEKEMIKEQEIEKKDEIQQKVESVTRKIDSGLDILNNYFSTNEMYIISQDVVRKNKELNFVIDLPSKIGTLRYFVKFKDKKTITDADLISALDEARSKKLPVLFLSKGQLAKKAEKYLNDNVSGQLVFRSL